MKAGRSHNERISKNRTITIRFRVTQDEADTIAMAAGSDALEMEEELAKRGLASGDSVGLESPGEWARQIVLGAALQRFRARGIQSPIEKRQEAESGGLPRGTWRPDD